jgi:hypothetical protein
MWLDKHGMNVCIATSFALYPDEYGIRGEVRSWHRTNIAELHVAWRLLLVERTATPDRSYGGSPWTRGPTTRHPPGRRNGQYRPGERSKNAITERQKFSALLKMLRAGL